MAGSESKVSPQPPRSQPETGRLGDWVAPIVAFIVVGAMLVAVSWILLGQAQ